MGPGESGFVCQQLSESLQEEVVEFVYFNK